MAVTIWHNPRCSKSRQTLALLEEKGIEPTIIHYLKAPPTVDDIQSVCTKLGVEPRDMMRKGEAVYRELGLAKETDGDKLIAAMADHPILIERPVVITGEKAVIGRPPESVHKIV